MAWTAGGRGALRAWGRDDITVDRHATQNARHLNMRRIDLSVEPENGAAFAVYQKLDFVEEGRCREHDFDDGCDRDKRIRGMLRGEFEVLDGGAPS